MKKENKIKSYNEFIDYIQSGRSINNIHNLKFVSFEKIGKRLHLGRYLLLQRPNGTLYVKYCTTTPSDLVISYANIRHEMIRPMLHLGDDD